MSYTYVLAGMNLGMRPANERRRYKVTPQQKWARN